MEASKDPVFLSFPFPFHHTRGTGFLDSTQGQEGRWPTGPRPTLPEMPRLLRLLASLTQLHRNFHLHFAAIRSDYGAKG